MKTRQKSWFRLVVLLPALVCSIDTARAQSNSLIANPTQLTFNGGSAPTQPLQISSSSGLGVNITLSTVSNNNWLHVSSASGVTPFTVFVSIGPTAPLTGSDAGLINISASGVTLSVLVQFNASSSVSPSPLSANPTSLNFNFAPNSTLPMTLPVAVSTSNSSTNSFTTSQVTSDGGNWLSVSPSAGTLPRTLGVTVNPVSLQGGGTFSAAIVINAPGSSGISLPVLVTVLSTPAINVSPAQLSFAYQIGTSQPFAQLSITSNSGATVSFTASAKTSTCGNNWIVLSQQSGATPSTLSVQVNTSSLSAGSCSGEIDVSAPGASNPSVVVPVKLLVSNNSLLQVPSSGPTFTYQLGTATVPAAQNVQITSSTPGLNFIASATASGSPNFLLLSPTSGATPLALTISVNPQVLANLGPATYTETVTISATADNSPQSFPVTLIVNSNPLLTANVPSLNFNYQIGQTAPSPQTITVNSTGAPLNYQAAVNASTCPGFLSASPSSGLTFSPPPQTQNQVVVSVNNITNLTAQVCSGNVTLTVPGSTTPPLVIPVTLNVGSSALLNVGQAAINVTALVGAGASAPVVSVSSTDPNSQLPFTALAATNPVGLTWLSVVPNSGNTPNNLQITINPANLQPGTYTGSINVSSAVPNVPAQTIPVTLVVASSMIIPTPTSLAFAQSVAGPQPPPQLVQITGVPAGTTIGAVATMLSSAGWLTASVSGNTVTVNATGSQLPIGSFQGVVTVIVPGAGNSPLYIPVTFTVSATPTLSVSPTTVGFTYTSGSATLPSSQTVAVTSTGSIPFNASFAPGQSIANPGNFITVTPASGTTGATLTLAVDPTILAKLSPGTYTGTVTVSSPGITSQTVNVTLTVIPAPPPVLLVITNAAASLQAGPIAPGELVSIFGTGLGPLTGVSFALTAANTVPTTLAGVTVKFNNVLAPLLFVRADQINAIVPYEIAGQPIANIVVQFGGSTSAALQANVVGTQPAIFSASQGGNGQGAILNQDYSANNAGNPAVKGTAIQIFGTGEGQLVPAVATGSVTPGVPPYSQPIATPIIVTIGGQMAEIQYAGEAPTLVSGVLQVNAVVPANIPSGNQRVVLTIGNNTNTSQIITVAVQ